jgi:hypothetical protein
MSQSKEPQLPSFCQSNQQVKEVRAIGQRLATEQAIESGKVVVMKNWRNEKKALVKD